MIPAGSNLTFQVSGSTDLGLTGIGTSPDSVRNAVISALTPFFDVYDVSLTADSLLQSIEQFDWDWSYTASVTVGTRVDYADVHDAGSIIAHAFYSATGALPVVTNQDYGDPAQSGQPIGYSGASIGGLLDGLNVDAKWLIVGLVVIVALVAFGPNTKAVASLAAKA